LKKALVQFNAGTCVVNGRGLAMNEIAAHHFVVRVIENAFEISLAGLLIAALISA